MEKTNIEKRKNIYKWLFISFLLLLIAVSGILTYFLIRKNNKSESYVGALQNTYSRNFNELSSNLNEIDVNISKLLGQSTSKARQKTLLTIWRDCFACQTNLASLPIEHESIEGTMSYINKLGEYCYFLSSKLLNGQNLSTSDLETIEKLSVYSNNLNHDISLLALNVSNGNFDVLNVKGNFVSDDFLAFLDDLQTSSVEVPSMIYDGPYSDGADEREIKGLAETECTQDEAQAYLAEIFKVDKNEVVFVSQTTAKFETYNFVVSNSAFAQVTKRGKFLLQFNKETADEEVSIDKDEAVQKAKDFLNYLGFNSVEENWINLNDKIYMINFATTDDGVTCYSDLIKIKLSGGGDVCGFEATNYAYNHTERTAPENLISKSEAMEVVDSRLDILNVRLCIIPKEFAEEVYAYEFYCYYGDSIYYVYINATTGEEEEIFKVVHDENEGELVI